MSRLKPGPISETKATTKSLRDKSNNQKSQRQKQQPKQKNNSQRLSELVWLELVDGLAAQGGDFGLVAKLDESVERGLDDVVRVG